MKRDVTFLLCRLSQLIDDVLFFFCHKYKPLSSAGSDIVKGTLLAQWASHCLERQTPTEHLRPWEERDGEGVTPRSWYVPAAVVLKTEAQILRSFIKTLGSLANSWCQKIKGSEQVTHKEFGTSPKACFCAWRTRISALSAPDSREGKRGTKPEINPLPDDNDIARVNPLGQQWGETDWPGTYCRVRNWKLLRMRQSFSVGMSGPNWSNSLFKRILPTM